MSCSVTELAVSFSSSSEIGSRLGFAGSEQAAQVQLLPIPYIRRNQRTTPADDSSARAGRALWYHNGNHRTADCAVTRDKQLQEPVYSLFVITT